MIRVIDSHTGGEPTRLVMAGLPDLGGGSVKQQAQVFRERFDHFRSAVINEPRGNDVLVGALLVPASDPKCQHGVIFFNNVGLLGMCGHGMIGVVATLAYLKQLSPGETCFETPVGNVTAKLSSDGRVSIHNVESYRSDHHVSIDVPGIGLIHGDVAWGGNWFFLTSEHGLAVELGNLGALNRAAQAIRRAINEQGFPLVDHVELFGKPTAAGADSKSFVLCPGGAFDRSPCGTGTSAKVACLAADGKLKPGETWVQESIVGSTFEATFVWSDEPAKRIKPTITGSAFVTAEATLVLNPDDPFCHGLPPMLME